MPETQVQPARRPLCSRCRRPASACWCRWIAEVDNRVEVLLLQHPLEQQHAKGSAALLSLSLRHCRLLVGERFEPDGLLALLHAPASDGRPARPLLLYPDAHPQALDGRAERPEALRLVVLDGTWRKSRKMLALNPVLLTLPRLSLSDPPPSRYRVRRAEQPQQRSTLEATVLALEQLEGDGARYAPLWAGFEGWVGQWLSHTERHRQAQQA